MPEYEVVETVYGKYSKYEIVKKPSFAGSAEFFIRKDGKPHRGPFSTMRAAVAAAEDEG